MTTQVGVGLGVQLKANFCAIYTICTLASFIAGKCHLIDSPFIKIQGTGQPWLIHRTISDVHSIPRHTKVIFAILKYLGIPNYYFKGKMHYP
jgi:hypothetical protein